MTVSYTAQVSSCKRFGCFWKLLFRWKGSIYKLLWPNLMVYIMLYTTLSFTYRFLLSDSSRTTFEKFSLHCQTYSNLIPVSFVLGFYVSIVIKRWWDQYVVIPWPDALAVYVSSFISGQDDRARLMRRTIMRYANLSLLLALRMMCPTVKKRFPTLDHLVEAGFLLPNEKKIFEGLEAKTSHPKYWLPLVWATAIARRARREGKVPDDFALKTLIDVIVIFRGGCGGLLNYDWISIPLVYTQVVTLAVYSYFAATLMGNQYLDPNKGYPNHTIDLVVPIFTLLQFFFYMGWLLVAETLVNPFGEDDDDFEVNWIIDRNLQVSYVIVDEMHEEHPELIKDQYWDQVFPSELPYTEAAKQYYMEPFLGSAFGVAVPEHMQGFIMMSEQMKDDRIETTPVLIKATSHDVAGSLPSFRSIGSSISIPKKKWKPFSKPTFFQPYSINSIYKFNGEDYMEDVFSMSGISVESSKMLGQQISSEIAKVGGDCIKRNVEQVLANELSNQNSPVALETEATYLRPSPNIKEEILINNCSKNNEASEILETSSEDKKDCEYPISPRSTVELRNKPNILPAVKENQQPSLLEQNSIRKVAEIELLTDRRQCECDVKNRVPSVTPYSQTLINSRSEAIDIPSKVVGRSDIIQKFEPLEEIKNTNNTEIKDYNLEIQ